MALTNNDAEPSIRDADVTESLPSERNPLQQRVVDLVDRERALDARQQPPGRRYEASHWHNGYFICVAGVLDSADATL
jgi:hypothetical protein